MNQDNVQFIAGMPIREIEPDVIEICGMRYTSAIFQYMGFGRIDTWFKLIKREDHVVSIETRDEWNTE